MSTPLQRLTRMQRMFAKSRAIFREDYNFFTQPPKTSPSPDAPTPPRELEVLKQRFD